VRVFENRALRRIFGPNRDGNRERKKLHNGWISEAGSTYRREECNIQSFSRKT
jgi:hypothetical protein